ncbi:unnamed protein product [Rhizophagus irregularis]|nr:unnamed protein product [Rhizophagus irregularis]
MGKPPHPFRPYFELISNPNNKSNKFAVESEYTEILTLNSNDGNKVIVGKRKEIEGVPCENEVNEDNKCVKVKATTTQALRQAPLTNYISRPLSTQDIPHFCQLFFNMVVSNGLPFSFAENPETCELFRFCIPAVNLPSEKALSGSVLKATSKNLVDSIIITAQNDLNGVTAAFDSWNSAGEYAAARRQMRVEYKDKIFLPCMAHQMNLVFGDIFKESVKYKEISTKAIRIVSFFHMASYFAGNLKDEQMLIYNKIIALTRPGDTRWNSYYFCFHSLLKTEAALKSLVAKYSPQRANLRNATTSTYKFLPADIVQIVNDHSFWSILFELQNLLLPLCGFLNKLQKDMARLHEVLHIFAFTIKLFRELPDLEFSLKMVERLEKRWVQGKYPFDPPTVKQFGQDIMSFWESCSEHTPELSHLALHLYSVCVNAASVERLWSTMGFFHTKRRNRLENKKVLEMARIRSDILYKRKIKEVEGGQKQARRLHIAPPILNNQEEEENKPVYEDDDEDLNVSDLEDDSSEEDNDSDEEEETRDDFHWSEICTNWINLVDCENQFDNEEDNHLLEMTYDFFAAGRDQHPADDETAK